jgi:hypothetical protein
MRNPPLEVHSQRKGPCVAEAVGEQEQTQSCAPDQNEGDGPTDSAEFPDPLRHALPDFLPPGRVAAPSVWINFLIFIGKGRLEGPTMQIQLGDIAGSESVLRQIREEEFVDDADTRNSNGTFLFACRMGCYNHAARHTFGPYCDVRTVVEAARRPAFRAMLKLIRR